jgi:hypothetical protein
LQTIVRVEDLGKRKAEKGTSFSSREFFYSGEQALLIAEYQQFKSLLSKNEKRYYYYRN